ncbi:MAG: Na+/H+ antiporter subunit C [Proteobacteria bacterium]|nr:Na+/H+ antiporter subunit C [Pseudomonadota bacterium]
MFFVFAVAVGVLFAAGVFLMLRPSVIRLVIGLVLMSHGANLLIFVAGGLRRGTPAIVADGALSPPAGYADPIPQALVLTAIVIGFAVVAFAAVLVKRVCRVMGTDELDRMREEVA